MRKVGSATDEENGIAVDETRYGGNVGAIGGCRAGDLMELDLEVGGGFLKGCVGG